jgi:2-oxo-3-hexenedioate decarboxylase
VVDVQGLAKRLHEAARTRQATTQLTASEPDLSLDDAYAIQQAVVEARVGEGHRVVGAKLGLTSRAKQVAMGVHEPLYAYVTSDMARLGEEIRLSEFIHPRVEPEIVFRLGRDLSGPGCTAADVLAATEYVLCGLEIIDSRYDGFSFTLADAVADNASSAGFVLGPRVERPTTDLALIGCVLEVDGEVVDSAAGAAVMGHPAEAVAMLANWLAGRGEVLRKDWIVLSGGLTAAVPLQPGTTVTAGFAELGSVTVRGVGE